MTANNTNIIEFPAHKIVREQVPEQVQAMKHMRQKAYLNSVVDEHSHGMLMNFYMAGVDIGKPEIHEKFAIGMECLRAALYETIGEPHILDDDIRHMVGKVKASLPQPMNEEEFEDILEEFGEPDLTIE